MKKQEYIKAVKEFAKEHREKAWECDQLTMIRAFVRDELKRARECFNENEEVGCLETLQDIANRFQGNWRYRKQSAMSFIF